MMTPTSTTNRYSYVLILCVFSLTHNNADESGSKDYIAEKHVETIHKVERRAIPPYGLMGILAWKKLLKGSVPVKTHSKKYRLYEKTGTFENAVADFYSVGPKNVKMEQDRPSIFRRTNQGTILTGSVGDKILRVAENGGRYGYYRPTLDVIGDETNGKYIDKIIYKPVDD